MVSVLVCECRRWYWMSAGLFLYKFNEHVGIGQGIVRELEEVVAYDLVVDERGMFSKIWSSWMGSSCCAGSACACFQILQLDKGGRFWIELAKC